MGTSLASELPAVLYGKALAALLIGFVSFAFLASTIAFQPRSLCSLRGYYSLCAKNLSV